MIGAKLYQKRSQVRVFLALYGLLALVGCALAASAIKRNQAGSGAVGFMIVFGTGMAVNTLIKSGKARVSVYEDFLEVAQSRTVRTLRYRNITGISRPDNNRMIVTLREEGAVKNEVIWTKELEPAEVERLSGFLNKVRGKGK